ncbi:MAG TPA: hypothetical protein VLJ39_15755 [Tepidisphaeraceae bacterium]|jgi:hypothetical protein|nr:hypothetical protein [Tepidisphaeraceae bacterium]
MTQVQTQTSRRAVPAWASALIIVGCIAAGAGLVYWFFTSGPAGNDMVVLDRGPQDGLKTVANNRNWSVVSGNTKMQVRKLPGDKFEARFGYLQYDFLAPGEFDVLNRARRLAADGAMAEAVGLTPEQTEKVKEQVRRGFDLDIAQADKDRLLELFKQSIAASAGSKDSRELALLRALDETGDHSTAAARQQTTDAVAKIRQIVTPEQWAKFDQIGK